MSAPSTQSIFDALLKSVRDTFSVQVGMPVEVTPAKFDQANMPNVDVLSVLGLKSSHFTGSLGLCFPKKSFLAIHEKMTGEKHQEINKENIDTCSELLNILYAGARVIMNNSGHDFQPAIPNTVRGEHMDITSSESTKILHIACSSACGPFWINLSLRKIEKI